MSKRKYLSRWRRGNERYSKMELEYIRGVYHEQPGWHKGARVTKR